MEFWVAIEATNLYDIVKWALIHYGIIVQWRFLMMLANCCLYYYCMFFHNNFAVFLDKS